jgi:MobA/MobL family
VAIFHLNAHERVSRSAGQSSLASAAYIMRAQYSDERTGQVYDFLHLDAPQWIGMFSPKDAPDWTREAANAERFWNALELFEKRKDAQIALPLDIALPHEMTQQQNVWLAQDYIRETFTRQGYVVLAAIHPPDHDERNIHLHLLVSLRKIDAHGFARTKTEQQDNYRNRDAYIENLREKWEHLANRHLERHGIDARIDRRTLQEQGIERAAQTHRGPTKSAVVFLEQDRAARAAAVAEIKNLQAQIIDLDATRAERETRGGQGKSSEIAAQKAAQMDDDRKSPANQNTTELLDQPEDGPTPAANQNEARFRQKPLRPSATLGPETLAASSPGEQPAPPFDQQRTTFRPTTNPEPGRYDELKPSPEPSAAPEAVAAAKADNFRVLPPDQSRDTVETWIAHQEPAPTNQNNPERVAVVAGQEMPESQPATAAPEWPYTIEEAIKRDPWNAVSLDLPGDASAESFNTIAGIAQDLRIDAQERAAAATSLEETEYWHDLALKADRRFDDALAKFYEAAGREGIDLTKSVPEIAPEAAQTAEPPPASEAPEQAPRATDGPQRVAQEQLTPDHSGAVLETDAQGKRGFASRFLDAIADRLGSAITYLSDLIAPPPRPTEAQIEGMERAAAERQEYEVRVVAPAAEQEARFEELRDQMPREAARHRQARERGVEQDRDDDLDRDR